MNPRQARALRKLKRQVRALNEVIVRVGHAVVSGWLSLPLATSPPAPTKGGRR